MRVTTSKQAMVVEEHNHHFYIAMFENWMSTGEEMRCWIVWVGKICGSAGMTLAFAISKTTYFVYKFVLYCAPHSTRCRRKGSVGGVDVINKKIVELANVINLDVEVEMSRES